MRRFTALLGATAPATTATLSAIFLGIGLGSAFFGTLAGRSRRPLLTFAALEAGIAAGALCVERLAGGGEFAGQPTHLLAARMALAMASMLPSTILMGGSLPVLAQAI